MIQFTVLQQISTMFLMIAVGYFLAKKNWLSEAGSQDMANILLRVCSPFIMINSFNITFSWSMLKGLGMTFLLSSLCFFASTLAARLVFKAEHRLEQFAVSFSNAGFIGIPLVSSLLGSAAVFYLTAYLVAFNIFAWTYGIYLISHRRELITLHNILLSPAMIGLVCGLVLFFSPMKLPEVLSTTLNSIGKMNTPMGMIILGTYIAKCRFGDLFKSRMAYLTVALRLVVAPLMSFGLLSLFPQYNEIRMVILIASCAPIGVMVALFAQQYDGDFAYGAGMVSLSTILCMVTIPLMLILAQGVWV